MMSMITEFPHHSGVQSGLACLQKDGLTVDVLVEQPKHVWTNHGNYARTT